MSKFIRDPQLDELVKELNRSGGAEEAQNASWPPAQIASGNPLEGLLIEMARRGASDLLVLAGTQPIFRVSGRLLAAEHPALTLDDVHALLGAFLTTRVRERVESDGCADFSVRLARPATEDDRRAWRFRVNIHRQRGTLAAAIRALPTAIPTLNDLNLPVTLADLIKPTRGLVLVCGPNGAGKTTTLAALVGELNRNESRHIITIEDPIEYEHRTITQSSNRSRSGAMRRRSPRRSARHCARIRTSSSSVKCAIWRPWPRH